MQSEDFSCGWARSDFEIGQLSSLGFWAYVKNSWFCVSDRTVCASLDSHPRVSASIDQSSILMHWAVSKDRGLIMSSWKHYANENVGRRQQQQWRM